MQSLPIVAFAEKGFRRENMLVRYRPLAKALGDLGCNAVVLNGADDHVGEGLFARHFIYTDQGLKTSTDLVRVGAARDLTGGIARYTPVSALNPQGIRDTVMSKRLQYEALSLDLGHAISESYFVMPNIESVQAAIHAVHADRVVLKPEKGKASRKVVSGTKQELAALLPNYLSQYTEADGLVVVQAYLENAALRFRDDLIPLTDQDLSISRRGGMHEIRVHIIDDVPFLVHGKVSQPEEQNQANTQYVFFDPESVQGEITCMAVTAAKALRRATGDRHSYLAVDLTPDGEWIIEVNGRNQGVITDDTPTQPHRAWVGALSQKLASMARLAHEPKKQEA